MNKMESQKTNKKVKNSMVLSGLVGTAGLFIAKMLGLLYSIPLSSILGSTALQSYYGTSYLIYSYLLNVFTAGIPFAISTVVAKYTVLNDNQSLVLLKKISLRLLGLMGLIGMAVEVILSGLVAYAIAPGQDYVIMRTSLQLLSLAILLVPILSAYRGFWQGRKEMEEYAYSQVFEQLFRVGFLLSAAYIVVYVLHMDRKFALYAAVFSTSVAAFAAIIQIYLFDKRNFATIKAGAREQRRNSTEKYNIQEKNKELLHELILLAIPYLLSAVVGYITQIYDSVLLPIGLRMRGYNQADIDTIMSGITYVGQKLTSIPEVLAPGFIAALIPHITEAITRKDMKRLSRIVTECFGIVLFIASAVCLCINLYSDDIFHILFYTTDQQLSSQVVKWIALDGFVQTLCPISSMIGIAMGLRRQVIRNLFMEALIKGVLMIPMILLMGYPGSIIAGVLGGGYSFLMNLSIIHKRYHIEFKQIFITSGKVMIALAAMVVTCLLLKWIGIDGNVGRKGFAFLKFILNAFVSCCVYLGVSQMLRIPEILFHRNIFALIRSKLSHKTTNA